MIKVRFIYTLVREDEIDNEELPDVIDFFKGAMHDETEEYLYGGASLAEKVSVRMEISRDDGKTWEEVK